MYSVGPGVTGRALTFCNSYAAEFMDDLMSLFMWAVCVVERRKFMAYLDMAPLTWYYNTNRGRVGRSESACFVRYYVVNSRHGESQLKLYYSQRCCQLRQYTSSNKVGSRRRSTYVFWTLDADIGEPLLYVEPCHSFRESTCVASGHKEGHRYSQYSSCQGSPCAGKAPFAPTRGRCSIWND